MSTIETSSILIVDDEAGVCDVLDRWLSREGHECAVAMSGESALERLEGDEFDVMLLDINMPKMSGIDVLAHAKQAQPDMSIVMVSGAPDDDAAQTCMALGAHSFILKPFNHREVMFNLAGALSARDRSRQQLDERDRLEKEVRSRDEAVHQREEEIALRLVAAAEYRDEESPGHIRRIGMYAEALARALGWSQQEADTIRVAAPMHDIGKIGIPDGILMKNGRLTPAEFDVVKQHCEIGARMVRGSSIVFLNMAEEIALSHHEKWDGSGYPQGLVGDEIPLAAHMVAIADVYDSLTCARAYRAPFSEPEALNTLRNGRGTHFDPEIFDAFMDVLPAFRHIKQQIGDLPTNPAAGWGLRASYRPQD